MHVIFCHPLCKVGGGFDIHKSSCLHKCGFGVLFLDSWKVVHPLGLARQCRILWNSNFSHGLFCASPQSENSLYIPGSRCMFVIGYAPASHNFHRRHIRLLMKYSDLIFSWIISGLESLGVLQIMCTGQFLFRSWETAIGGVAIILSLK